MLSPERLSIVAPGKKESGENPELNRKLYAHEYGDRAERRPLCGMHEKVDRCAQGPPIPELCEPEDLVVRTYLQETDGCSDPYGSLQLFASCLSASTQAALES